jgi:phosphoribosylformylglycinamidine (FGAM) synthase-like enzyme
VTVLLEDMGLNLQSMMASPFVRPFLEDVRKWEQRLSLIGECTEVWQCALKFKQQAVCDITKSVLFK